MTLIQLIQRGLILIEREPETANYPVHAEGVTATHDTEGLARAPEEAVIYVKIPNGVLGDMPLV